MLVRHSLKAATLGALGITAYKAKQKQTRNQLEVTPSTTSQIRIDHPQTSLNIQVIQSSSSSPSLTKQEKEAINTISGVLTTAITSVLFTALSQPSHVAYTRIGEEKRENMYINLEKSLKKIAPSDYFSGIKPRIKNNVAAFVLLFLLREYADSIFNNINRLGATAIKGASGLIENIISRKYLLDKMLHEINKGPLSEKPHYVKTVVDTVTTKAGWTSTAMRSIYFTAAEGGKQATFAALEHVDCPHNTKKIIAGFVSATFAAVTAAAQENFAGAMKAPNATLKQGKAAALSGMKDALKSPPLLTRELFFLGPLTTEEEQQTYLLPFIKETLTEFYLTIKEFIGPDNSEVPPYDNKKS